MRGGIEGAFPARPADGRARVRPALAREALPSPCADTKYMVRRERTEEQARARWQTPEEEEAVIASINTKLQAMHERGLAAMSPRTRAAWEEFKRLEALDKAEGYNAYDDPEHPSYIDRSQGGRADSGAEPPSLPPPDWRKGAEADEEEPESNGPRLRGIKDERWE